MSEENARLIQRQLRSPRSAAIAGILFSLLMGTSMFLMFDIGTTTPADINRDWLETWSSTTLIVLPLVPFAGIAFLWFTGVIRDRLGDREDRFFATIFFGSGIIVVVMMFTWAATIGALFRTHAAAADLLADNDIFIFGFTFMNEIIVNYALRMVGVYMLSIASLWTRTDVMPRWITIITFVVALGFLFFAGRVREARFIFPAWVFLVSSYILITNRRISL